MFRALAMCSSVLLFGSILNSSGLPRKFGHLPSSVEIDAKLFNHIIILGRSDMFNFSSLIGDN